MTALLLLVAALFAVAVFGYACSDREIEGRWPGVGEALRGVFGVAADLFRGGNGS